jgi:hypothetical protein
MEICINGPGAGTEGDAANEWASMHFSCQRTMTSVFAQSGIKSAPLHDARLSRQLPSPSIGTERGIAIFRPVDGFELSLVN